MGYYDQHMHTHFSPDSAESFENYLEQTDGLLVTTEHLDFQDAYNGGVIPSWIMLPTGIK